VLAAVLLWYLAKNQGGQAQDAGALAVCHHHPRLLVRRCHLRYLRLRSDYSLLQCAINDSFIIPRNAFPFDICRRAHFRADSTSFIIALGELPFCLSWIPSVKAWSATVAPYLEQ